MFRGCLLLLLCAGCSRLPEVPIFLWHSVAPTSGDPLELTPAELDEQLKLIASWQATPVTLAQVFDARDRGAPLPKRPVVLTFDDGRAGLLEHATPVLKKHQAVAELFVVTDWIADAPEQRKSFTDERGTHPALTWPELKQMAEGGSFVIESHSVSHARLGELDEGKQAAELEQSRRALRERLKVPADFFAWPFGALGSDSKRLAKEAGYRGAVTVEAHGGGPYGLKRISVWRDSTHVVREALVAAWGAP